MRAIIGFSTWPGAKAVEGGTNEASAADGVNGAERRPQLPKPPGLTCLADQ